MRLTRAVVGALVAVALSACGSVPRDPDGTLERVQEEQVLRVGASASPDRVVVAGDQVSGEEADLATGFAAHLGARVEWMVAGETDLVAAMERGELDLIIGGLDSTSPWADKIGITRPYAESTEHGMTIKHVLAVPIGENAMLVRLERYLDEATE